MDEEERPVKRRKRAVACSRCHSHKIKCSGEQPCQSCQNANATQSCNFPHRDRNVTVPGSYLDKLEAQVRGLKEQLSATPAATSSGQDSQDASHQVIETITGADADVPNPLLEVHHGPPTNHTSSFAGEASCTAFGDRLLHCVNKSCEAVPNSAMPDHVSHPVFNRLTNPSFQLPNRVQASLLIRRVDRFIGNNYQLFLKKSFFEQFDRAYNSGEVPDLLWACHFFALLALGELYSSYSTPGDGETVPGTANFVQAVALLQDQYERPSVEQVQILLLLSFYANSIGRLQSAHAYCGIALRLSVSLGLHRTRDYAIDTSPVAREYRCRIWWTLYLFDRLISSKLGYPLGIRDEDIDVELPSDNRLSKAEKEEFHDSVHLCAHAKLAKITGSILSDVYCLPHRSANTFVRRVHRVLNELRRWDTELPTTLRLQANDSARNLYTLHMHYHLCIIQTTRPILLHIFKITLQSPAEQKRASFSPTTLALGDACTQSARVTNQLLSKLFIEGNLAMFGYFDSHYLFSSTLILIIAAVMEPSATMSDAVQVAFNLLSTMASRGNVSSKDYLSRLEHIRASVSAAKFVTNIKQGIETTATPAASSDEAASHGVEQIGFGNEWSLSDSLFTNDTFESDDPLGNPFIENFLAEKAFEWPSGPSPQEDVLRQFAHELGDEFVFGS
ncbi:hypothetical protein Slin15195_G066340 [Septoria linicola]|uniref:Zn(2)-C6 fungal-type domain-containing protein n=1 Tax=Septoria linicola TaxID=215465 RepID=A0A9Q9AQM4_9PEZI|nr:hypothetical protein Slin15195_G066340 [Septoria linicola]